MKILKIFGVVVGIHLFALMLIFVNPGCSSTSKPPPAPIDTLAKSEPGMAVSVPGASPTVTVPAGEAPVASAPINFNPDAPALPASYNSGIRFTPTRPNTAAASTLVAEPVKDITPATTYTVKGGDSLWSIASKNHLTYTELAAANNLKTNAVLQPGQKLLIPGKAPASAAKPAASSAPKSAASAATAAKPAPADAVKHTVKSGESLSSIAKTYGVKMGDIAVANNITDPQKIRAGMVLVIPGWKATGTKPKPADTGVAKPAVEPLFTPPANDTSSPVTSAPSPTPKDDVPVVPVTEAPAPKKP